ncbi:MAG: serine/threonine protein kinase [Phycisphaerales bacterium]|nr:MAG: serine/threonine protein kinase [Phycisphaerales bacterium]
MSRRVNSPIDDLQQQYSRRGRELDFQAFLADIGPLQDELLAALIEHDGRCRVARGYPVTLDRYFEAVKDLRDRRDPLDAAIDVTLRSLARSSRFDASSVDTLVSNYPELERLIREAAALNNAMWSTTGVRARVEGKPRLLPEDFGPRMPGGELRYELKELLGAGAFGEVYLAIDRQLSEEAYDARVAIKILQSADRSDWMRRQLIEEATKARRIDHPNVVRVLDRGVSSDDEDFIVYELVEGGDLGRWLREQSVPIEPAAAARLVGRISRGIAAAHNAGLVHCDLKPGNIMMTTDGAPKVADFGIAIRAGESMPDLQHKHESNRPVGNIAFISPEQFRMDEGSLTIPSDVYALGGILYYMLTGELPNGSNRDEIGKNHHPEQGRQSPPSVREINPRIDSDLDRICRRAMAIDPDERYASASAMAEDLERWLQREPIPWLRPSIRRRLGLWVRRKPVQAALTSVIVLTVIGGTVAGAIAVHSSQRAVQSAQQAEIAAQEAMLNAQQAELMETRAALQRERTNRAVDSLIKLRDGLLEIAAASTSASDVMPVVWSMELLFERTGVHLDFEKEDFDQSFFREFVMRHFIEKAIAEDRLDSIEVLLWMKAIAFYNTARGQIDEAESMLELAEPKLRRMLHPTDPVLLTVDLVRFAIASSRLTEGDSEGALDEPDHRAEMEALLEQLDELMSRWPETSESFTYTVMYLEAVERLTAPEWLNDSERYEEAQVALSQWR